MAEHKKDLPLDFQNIRKEFEELRQRVPPASIEEIRDFEERLGNSMSKAWQERLTPKERREIKRVTKHTLENVPKVLRQIGIFLSDGDDSIPKGSSITEERDSSRLKYGRKPIRLHVPRKPF